MWLIYSQSHKRSGIKTEVSNKIGLLHEACILWLLLHFRSQRIIWNPLLSETHSTSQTTDRKVFHISNHHKLKISQISRDSHISPQHWLLISQESRRAVLVVIARSASTINYFKQNKYGDCGTTPLEINATAAVWKPQDTKVALISRQTGPGEDSVGCWRVGLTARLWQVLCGNRVPLSPRWPESVPALTE